MLPSLGCFSSLECPFYNGGAGQCSRPYCHYRHVKRDVSASPEENVLGSLPNTAPEQNEDEVKAGTSESSHRSRASMYKAIVDAAPAYNPTPISQLKSSHIPIPYTPTVPTRSAAVKKSKPSSEYVPHHVGTSRPSYPAYCPSSISSLNSQTTSSSDPLKNPLYEMYGPEGAQYSPNDVEPIGTGYSYAPENSSYSPYSPEYVPSKVKYNPTYSLQESQLSDDDDVDLAAETAAQLNGDPSGGESLIDLDLSELDNLELEFEEDGNDNEPMSMDTEENQKPSTDTHKTKESEGLESSHISSSSSHKAEKRRSSSVSSSNESKKPKVSHGSSDKNGHSEKSSSSSSLNKTSSSSSHSKKSSSSSSKSKSSSSSSSKTSSSKSSSKPSSKSSSSSSSKTSSSGEAKKSHSTESKSKSSSSSSSSKHKDKHRDKEKDKVKDKEKDKEKDRDRGKDKESGKNKDSKSKHSKKSSHKSDDEKGQQEIRRVKLEEEIRKIEVELDASLEDEDMIEQQCYEMFSEFSETIQNQPTLNTTEDQRVTVNDEPAPSASSKKRIAHQASHSSSQSSAKPVPTVAKKSSPYQVMRDRWEMLKKEKMQSLDLKASLAVAPASVPRPIAPVPYSSTNVPQASLPNSTTVPAKKKIAGVSNVAMLLKPPTTSNVSSTSTPKNTGTSPSRFYNKTTQRVDEYGRLVKVRVAHAPNMDAPVMRKPVVNPSDCRKFKVATRQANVNKLFQAYIDAGFGESAHDMALESEKSSTQGTESLGVYSHRIIQTLKDLRACAESSQNGPKVDGMSGIPNRVVSHSAMIAGKLGSKVSWSIQSGKKETEAKPQLNLYEQMKPYILTKEQLEENGFPMPSGEKGVATMKPSSFRVIHQPSDPRQKICVRCLKPYSINKHGEQVKEEECFYHWGRKFKRFREAETKYTCCDGTGSGCSISPYHVFEQNWEKNSGYMSTLSKPHMESNPGIYALDCEMCYTTAGIELTRVTVIKEDLSVAYETLVKPANKILDYNTRFSGITEEDLKGVTTSILQVQATLLGMFCDKTILVGHSLESDMKALKLIHPTVVDSSVVFPHKMGPPKKRALRNLAAEYLKKIIQNDVGGHDSKEDAVSALELILWKLKEDQKTR